MNWTIFGVHYIGLLLTLSAETLRATSPQASINRARGRPTWQSSTYTADNGKAYNSSLAVDGNKQTRFDKDSCSHTKWEVNPWWVVDLGKLTRVQRVKLTNRGDEHGARTRGFIVGLSNVAPMRSTPVLDGYEVCGQWPSGVQNVMEVECAGESTLGRYVIIQLPLAPIRHENPEGKVNLNFCELEVFGEDVDECVVYGTNPCGSNAKCTNKPTSYSCRCDNGYTNQGGRNGFNCTDIDECKYNDTNLCELTAECKNTPGSYTCQCLNGYTRTGHTIDGLCMDIDECSTNTHRCVPNSDCINAHGSYYCRCKEGFEENAYGFRRCNDIDECKLITPPCHPNAQCINTEGSYLCTCNDGYYTGNGADCIDIDECVDNGLCAHNCHNDVGSYHCSCPLGHMLTSDGKNCIDINECLFNNANCSRDCNNVDGGYYCSCPDGYDLLSDNRTCDDTNECLANNGDCSHDCHNIDGSYHCSCFEGYELTSDNKTCIDIDECNINHGSCSDFCTNVNGSHHCSCADGFVILTENRTQCIALPLSSPASAAVVGSCFAVLFIIATGAMLVLLIAWHRTKSTERPDSRVSRPGVAEKLDCNSGSKVQRESASAKGVVTASNKSPTIVTAVRLSQLSQYIKNLRDSDGFVQQFAELPLDDVTKCTVGKLPEVKTKNRFVNILPYDNTRVKLPTADGAPVEDGYINASYIKTFTGDGVAYIATQAPKPETVNDFWLMIWHEKVHCITALVLQFEGGKARCHCYWLNEVGESAEFGKITVKLLTDVETFAEYNRRTMSIEMQGMKPRTVIQFQYLVWPDKSVPDQLCSLISFRNRVRGSRKSASSNGRGPLVVHCSAGVGRTGTFIALDTLLDEADRSGTVDVFSVVKHLRNQRMSCVQVKDQYMMLYNALLDYYRVGRTSVSWSVVAAAAAAADSDNITDNERYRAAKTEFKLLNQLRSIVSESEELTGLQPLNINKNRRQDVIAPDKYRVILKVDPDGTDYINAAIATGCKNPTHYILAQLPLENTTDDFWQMIDHEKCNSVVMLDRISDRDPQQLFWPLVEDTPTAYGDVIVRLRLTHSFSQRILVHDLELSTKDGNEDRVVRVHELMTWIEGHETPNNVDDFLELIHSVATWEQEILATQEKVVAATDDDIAHRCLTVICSDGATRSGLYAATSSAVDRLTCYDELDTFLSCRYIAAARPQTITTQEQYDFVYRTAMVSRTWTPGRQLSSVDETPLVDMGDGGSEHPIYGNIESTWTIRNDDSNIYANSPSGGFKSQNDEQNLYANFTG